MRCYKCGDRLFMARPMLWTKEGERIRSYAVMCMDGRRYNCTTWQKQRTWFGAWLVYLRSRLERR